MSKRGGCRGLLIVGGSTLGILLLIGGIIFGALFGIEPLKTGRLSSIDDPANFDMAAAMPQVVELAGPGLAYWQMNAQAVRADGTIDLSADYAPTALVQFFQENGRAAPVGAPGGQTVRLISIRIDKPGMKAIYNTPTETHWAWSPGMSRLELDTFPKSALISAAAELPRCAFKGLWEQAIALGAPADAVAAIHHDSTGYTFRIEGTEHSYRFDQSCARIP
jgi:hypothetical protein